MQHIETIELTSSQSSITFSSIPQDYDDLVILCSLRTNRTGVEGGLRLTAGNGTLDTGSNYSNVLLIGNGSSANSVSGANENELSSGTMNGSDSTSNTFGNATFYISNYTSSTDKSISVDSVGENNSTSAGQALVAGLFTSSSAIDIVSIFEDKQNLDAGSIISLYGITAGGSGTVTTS